MPTEAQDLAFAEVMIHLKHREKCREIRKVMNVGRHKFEFHWRSKANMWGRFGGGWNWELGIQVGRSTVILSCLTFTLSWRRRKKLATAQPALNPESTKCP